MQGIYKSLGQMNVTTATGGSATTAIDTKQTGLHRDDDWKEGTLFVIHDAAGAGASPEGKFQRISGYTDSNTTFTIDTTVTDAIAAGDTFGFTSQKYPLHVMIQMVNDGLRLLGDVPAMDTTTLDTATSKTEYAAAVAWKRRRPYRVDIQTKIDDSDDNQWVETTDYDWVPAAGGSTGLIVFHFQPVTTRDIRVWYRGPHPDLYTYSDVVNETIDPELAILAGTLKALEWRVSRSGGADPFEMQRLNDAKVEFARRSVSDSPEKPKRGTKLFIVGPQEDFLDPRYTGTVRI